MYTGCVQDVYSTLQGRLRHHIQGILRYRGEKMLGNEPVYAFLITVEVPWQTYRGDGRVVARVMASPRLYHR